MLTPSHFYMEWSGYLWSGMTQVIALSSSKPPEASYYIQQKAPNKGSCLWLPSFCYKPGSTHPPRWPLLLSHHLSVWSHNAPWTNPLETKVMSFHVQRNIPPPAVPGPPHSLPSWLTCSAKTSWGYPVPLAPFFGVSAIPSRGFLLLADTTAVGLREFLCFCPWHKRSEVNILTTAFSSPLPTWHWIDLQ